MTVHDSLVHLNYGSLLFCLLIPVLVLKSWHVCILLFLSLFCSQTWPPTHCITAAHTAATSIELR